MTIALRAAGTPTNANANVGAINPSPPAGWVSGDVSILCVQVKPDTTSIATPANWTKIGEWTGGTGTQGTDTGPSKSALYYRLDSPSAPGNIGFTGANSASAVIHIFSKTESAWDLSQSTSGADTTHTSNIATDPGANIDITAGDWVLVNWAGANDSGAVTTPDITAAGATIGSVTTRSLRGVTTGQDLMAAVVTGSVTAGPSTGGPAFSFVNALNQSSGHASFLRLRETTAVLKHGSASGTIDVNGMATGHAVHHGTATGSVDTDGSAAGHAVHAGTATGVIDLDGSATGEVIRQGGSSGQVDLSGSAEGSVLRHGSGEGSVTLDGSATGSVQRSGDAAGSVTIDGTAVGGAVQHGSASGGIALDGSATGHAVRHGSSSGFIVLGGAATGVNGESNSGSGEVVLDGTAAGTTLRHGASSGFVVLGGGAESFPTNSGTATGSITLDGSATAQPELGDIVAVAAVLPSTWTAMILPAHHHAEVISE